jgi:hypothetical protein
LGPLIRHFADCHPERCEGPAFSADPDCHPERSEGPAFPLILIVILSAAKDLLFPN